MTKMNGLVDSIENGENVDSKSSVVDELDGHQNLENISSIDQSDDNLKQFCNFDINLSQPVLRNENINDSSYEATESNNELVLLTENTQLKETLLKNSEQYGNVLQHKDEVIELQKKELALLEAEKDSLRREYETGKKEKEQAVVRYVMLEKSIIDANSAKDLSARKLRDSQKEIEILTNRLKAVSGERDKTYKEIRDYIRENEQLKYDLQTMETKVKWGQRNLMHEKAYKSELEKKLNDATEQLNSLNEQRQLQMYTEKKSEQEQGAQVIMLKHSVDEKERNLFQLQKSYNELKSDFADFIEKKENVSKELELEQQKCIDLQTKLNELECSTDERNRKYEEIQSKLELCESSLQQCNNESGNLNATINKLKYIEESYRDQSEEMVTLRNKEDEFLLLLKELTEKCVLVENKLILANSKSSALMLDNERLNKEQKSKTKTIQGLEDDLVKIKLKHSEEIKLFNRILADERNHNETLQNKLDNIVGDLEATKNKHSQVVKELNRELVALRKHSNQSSNDLIDADIENQSSSQGSSSGIVNYSQEPSKKVLIDRIVKLQRQLAKQTEKIEFLENHCVALFNELKSKTV